jgi:sugar phosphate isomerase/epimerase
LIIVKIGICTGIPAYVTTDQTAGVASSTNAGTDMINLAAELGYDYVELALAPLADLDRDAYGRVKRYIDAAPLKCECMNVFFPVKIRLTGDGRNEPEIEEYAARALARAAELGAGTVVFGSGGARNIPDGFQYKDAFEQLVYTMLTVSNIAAEHGVRIAIEPLNRNETNIIRDIGEAEKLMLAADRPNIRLLLDYYHFTLESDSVSALRRLSGEGRVIHAHFADPDGRVFPSSAKPEYEPVFDALRAGGYDARCSIEAGIVNRDKPRSEMAAGLAALRALAG